MPSVTVKLAHTQKPDDCTIYTPSSDEGSGITVDYGNGTVEITRSYVNQPISKTLSFTPAEALALANALTLVAGCADTRWRGWHWEAREQNGQLLATTPVGEWYANAYDCITAIGTLFGTESVVRLDDKWHGNVTIREPQATTTPDADPEEYPVGKVEL